MANIKAVSSKRFNIAITYIVSILSGLVKTKILAAMTGIEGIGFSSFLNKNISTAQSIISFGLHQGLINQYSEIDTKRMVERVFFSFMLYVGIVASFVLIWVFRQHNFDIRSYSILGALYFLVEIGNLCLRAILNAKGEQIKLNKRVLLSRLTSIPITYFFIRFFGIHGLLPALLIVSILEFAVVFLSNSIKPLSLKQIIGYRSVISNLYVKGAYHGLSTIIGKIITLLTVVIIENKNGLEGVGQFAIMVTLIDLSFSLGNQVLMQQYYPDTRDSFSRDGKLPVRLVEVEALRMTGFAITVLLFVYVIFPVLIPFVYEIDPADYMPYFILYSFTCLNRIVISPVSYLSLITGNRQLFFWYDGILSNLILGLLPLFFYQLYDFQQYFTALLYSSLFFLLSANLFIKIFTNDYSTKYMILSVILGCCEIGYIQYYGN